MYALREIYDAVNDCESGDMTMNLDGSSVSWDKAYSFLIGSIEGFVDGGSKWIPDGQLQYALVKDNALTLGHALNLVTLL